MRAALKSVAPLRDVLNASNNSCINSCINLHCMNFIAWRRIACRVMQKVSQTPEGFEPSLPPAGTAHSAGGRSISFYFSFFCIFFACKNLHENRHLDFSHFLQIFAISGRLDVDFNGFWAPKQVPGGSFFDAFFVLWFWIVFLYFFRKQRSKAKNEKVGFVL